jgi:hypothetical protein
MFTGRQPDSEIEKFPPPVGKTSPNDHTHLAGVPGARRSSNSPAPVEKVDG